jgi:hypothetical protein
MSNRTSAHRLPLTSAQQAVCTRFAAIPEPPEMSSKVGIALQTRGQLPLNAVRRQAEHGTSGWYLWWGDTWTDDTEFYQPLHVEHLTVRCPEILPYLALRAGWRVQIAPDHEDVWFDAEISKA